MPHARLCPCHGEPMLFHKASRYRAGGFWHCRVRHQETCRRLSAERGDLYNANRRHRYDNDPIYRIEKRLRDDARARRKTIERRRERLGALPD